MLTPALTLRSPRRWRTRMGTLVAMASMALGAAAWADESIAEGAQFPRDVPELQLTTERTWLQPGAAAALGAQGRPLGEMAGVSVRWWAGHGRSTVGLGLGTVGYVVPGLEDPRQGSLRAAVPTLTIGWRYHVSRDTALYADATGARQLAADVAPGLYNTKVGMEWQPAKPRFGFENRSLGIQLQSGYRMSLRVKSGGLGFHFRGNF